jgi:hypothetical protein
MLMNDNPLQLPLKRLIEYRRQQRSEFGDNLVIRFSYVSLENLCEIQG